MVKSHLIVMGGALAGVVAAVVSVRATRHEKKAEMPPHLVAITAEADGGAIAAVVDAKVSAGPPSMIHLDPHHTNRSPFEGPVTPNVAWTFDAGGPIEAAPAVLADGTIVVASLGGKLFALSDKGELKFSVDLGDRGYSAPLLLGEVIYVGSDSHKFFGVSREGVVRFKLDAPGDVDTGAAPTPWGGIVFASGRVLHAMKPDGTLFWRVQARKKCYASPAVGDDGTVYVGCQDHYLYAVGSDGKVRWKTDLGGDVDASPAIADDGTIYAGSDKGEVFALTPETGEVRWSAAVGGFVRGALSIGRDGVLLAGTYGPTPRMIALEPNDGRVRFRFAIAGTGAQEFGIHGGPVEDAAGRLYFGAQDDHVYCLRGDGTLVFKWKTGGDVDAPVVITPKGTLLVGSDDGKLYALGPN